MGKNMALLSGNTVANMIWCSDTQAETDVLKFPGDRTVGIGDTYENGVWYRDGQPITTQTEDELARLRAENQDMRAALDAIYQGVSV